MAPATRYLNLAFAILLLFPVAGLGRDLLRGQSGELRHLALVEDSLRLRAPSPPPDIYLIVLDAYTGPRSLREVYGFDSAGFEAFLRDRGFVVPEDSRSNYVLTFLMLASMLNWDYVDRLMPLDRGSPDQTPLYRLIELNRTAYALKGLGYRFVFFPTSFAMTDANRLADVQIPAHTTRYRLFNAAWIRTTVLFPLYRWLVRGEPTLPFSPEPGERLMWKFDELARLPELEGPLLVFAHLLLPHEPFHFRADCSLREPFYWPLEIAPQEQSRVREAYVEQLQCTNRLVARLVDRLLARSETPPVILLQSDHGYARFDKGQPLPLERSAPDQVRERIDAFAAYHLPGVEPGEVPHGITPVNAMRLVMNRYFGAGLPLLEDLTLWSHRDRPFDFTPVAPDGTPLTPPTAP